MKNKKWIAMIVSFLVIVSLIGVLSSLLGFRLAKKNGAAKTEPDRLVGFLITTESLNFDIFRDDSNNYQLRSYATVNKTTQTDEETGATLTFDANKYSFDGVDGICFFVAKTDGHIESAIIDEGIFDSSVKLGAADIVNESISISGTVYARPIDNFFFDVNNVYQSADGRIYAVFDKSHLLSDEGIEMSFTQEENLSYKSNSDNQSYSFSGTLSVKRKYPAESVTIFQMNSDNEILAQDEYIPGELPDTFEPTKGADYLIVEINYNETSGNHRTERSIISNTEESIVTIYYPQGSNWAVGQLTEVEWAD